MATIAKTVGSFDKVLASCKTIGTQYQPNVAGLMPAALSELRDRVQQSLEAASVTRMAYRMAVNNRTKSFAGIPKLTARVVRVMAVYSKDDPGHLEEAAILNSFLRSRRRQKSDKVVNNSTEPAQATRASGRLSYDQQMETFNNLLKLVGRCNYNPNDANLALDGLTQKLDDLRARSLEVVEAQEAFRQARLERNRLIYGKDGIRERTRDVRNYIQGIFGIISIEAEQFQGKIV